MALEDMPVLRQPAPLTQPTSEPAWAPYQHLASAAYHVFNRDAEPLLSEIFLLGDDGQADRLATLAEELIDRLDQADAALPLEDPEPMAGHLANWRLLAEGLGQIARPDEAGAQGVQLAEKLARKTRWHTPDQRELALLLAGRLYRQAGQPARTIEVIGSVAPQQRQWRPVRLALRMEVLRALAEHDDLPVAILVARRLEQTCLLWKPSKLRQPAGNAVAWLRVDLNRQWAEQLEEAGETEAAAQRRDQLADWLLQRQAGENMAVLRLGRLFDPPRWLRVQPASSAPARPDSEEENKDD